MIEGSNSSKTARSGEFMDIKKYVGVASVNILAINPNNAKLRMFGWDIPDNAEEPVYVTEVEKNGTIQKRARVRFMVQIQDLPDKPVIPLDFWIRKDKIKNGAGTKGKIIDCYGRTAWGTAEEIKAKKIPVYKGGTHAQIASNYKMCHYGEEELVTFLIRYLGISPYNIFNRDNGKWEVNKNPGKLTIDNWDKLCDGDVSELSEYIALQPDNCVKVVLGIRFNDDNRSYQFFLTNGYIGNGASPERISGTYKSAETLIAKYMEEQNNRSQNSPGYTVPMMKLSPKVVKEFKVEASDVKEQAVEDMPETVSTPQYESITEDLPF